MIQRDRTAIRRTEFSRPVRTALRDCVVSPATTVLDYGCGLGDDVRHLRDQGISASGWDPAHQPATPKAVADVVNLGYVLNVVERLDERSQLLREAWGYARRVLIVAARLKTESDGGLAQFEDGVITRLRTFQKYYEQRELGDWIGSILGEQPVAAAPGVFYVFRDEIARESFVASRYRRRVAAPKVRLSDKLFEDHQIILQHLILFVTERGRLPIEKEISVGAELRGVFGSVKRAFQLVRRVTGPEPWDAIIAERRNDLMVYLALGRFPRRPKLSSIPSALQLDIKALFGTYKKACAVGDELLFAVGDMTKVDRACKAATFGKLMPTALYVHAGAVHRLPAELRVYEGCARVLTGEVEGTTLVKLRRHEAKVSYLAYPSFDVQAHPRLVRSLRVDLRSLDLKDRDFKEAADPPVLHRKEEFVPADYPNRDMFAALTEAEVKAGLFAAPERIGTVDGWREVCKAHRLRILNHLLVPDQSQEQ